MKRETVRALVEDAPPMDEDKWDELGTFVRRHVVLQSFLRHAMFMAQQEADKLVNLSSATPEGREQSDLCKGAARGLVMFVGNACDLMGDLNEEPEDTIEEEEKTKKRARQRRTHPSSRRRPR